MSFFGRLFGGASPGRPDLDAVAPGDRVSAGGEEWTVRAIIHYRMEDNEWPSVQIERGDRSAWISYEDDALVRYDPGPDLHLANDGTIAWRGRVYTVEDAGTATVSRVTGPVDVAPGDRVRYHTLTSPDDDEGWLSVESWDSGYVEISIGRTWAVDVVPRPR